MEEQLMDEDGENRAVRFFLMQYGWPGLTVGAMRLHMQRCGFPYWPEWAERMNEAHLTKSGAQLWLRHLFSLEPASLVQGTEATAGGGATHGGAPSGAAALAVASGKPELAPGVAIPPASWAHLPDAEVLKIAPMAGNFSADEVAAFCGGFRRCAQALAAGVIASGEGGPK